MKTTLVLTDEVARRAKRRAAELGISLSEFTDRSLRDALTEAAAPRGRITLPTTGHGLPKRAHSVEELRALENDVDT